MEGEKEKETEMTIALYMKRAEAPLGWGGGGGVLRFSSFCILQSQISIPCSLNIPYPSKKHILKAYTFCPNILHADNTKKATGFPHKVENKIPRLLVQWTFFTMSRKIAISCAFHLKKNSSLHLANIYKEMYAGAGGNACPLAYISL